MFKKRALFSVGGIEANIRQFDSGQSLLAGAVDLSNRVGTINRINLFFHGISAGAVGGDSRLERGTPNTGFYIEDRANYVYQRSGDNYTYPLSDRDRALGARGAKDFVDLILGRQVNIAEGGEIVLYGCHTDALASHIQWLLKSQRPDIRVTGATGFVDFRFNRFKKSNEVPAAWSYDGWWNTWTGSDHHWEGGDSRWLIYR